MKIILFGRLNTDARVHLNQSPPRFSRLTCRLTPFPLKHVLRIDNNFTLLSQLQILGPQGVVECHPRLLPLLG